MNIKKLNIIQFHFSKTEEIITNLISIINKNIEN